MMDISKIVENTLKEYEELQKLTPSPPKKEGFGDSMRFLEKFKTKLTTVTCIKKEGYMKIRENDQNNKEIPPVYAILSKDRFTYFLDPSDESSIQGSIKLDKIQTPLLQIENYPCCFELLTTNNQNGVVCTEDENTTRDWIFSITQNIVNCG